MKPVSHVTYSILSWSHKTYRARRNYKCAHCGGVIPMGVRYMRHVERLGARKGVDPLRNVHVHLDCQAPWYQPEAPHRLKALGRLPGRTPPADTYNGTAYFHKPSVALTTAEVGTLQWQPEASLAAKLMFASNQQLALGAMAEIEVTLQIVMTAITQAAGNKRKAMKLNHLIEAISHLLGPIEVSSKA